MNDTPVFSHAAAAAPHSLAAQAGRDILVQGGNAIEAMVAMAATIAVVYPHMNAIGGDGFWLIREPNGKVRAIEACGFAGEKATPEFYRLAEVDAIPPRGPQAALTVPGSVGGWALALELSAATGGRLPLGVLMENAIRHALDGYPVSPSETRFDPTKDKGLIAAPGFTDTYFIDGKPAKAGDLRKVTRLGETLAQLAHAGLDDFYRGDVAREIAGDLERLGSPVTRADLKTYRAAWRQPLSLRIAGATLYNTQPPTQGLASLILMGLFERLNVRNVESFAYFHGLIEASKRALSIRDHVVTDFDQLEYDCADFLAAEALDRGAAEISMTRAASLPLKFDQGDTVWMGAIDAQGRAVSFIQSIYWEFGSGCVLPRTGVLMQNRGVSFSLDSSAVNPLQPGRRPLHTLNPPLCVFDDGRVMSYGAMGGDGQPQFQAQLLTRYRAGQNLAAALDAPRYLFGRSWGAPSASVKLEDGFDDGIGHALARAGHEIDWAARGDAFGHAGALVRGAKGAIEAAHDPRSDGGAEGI
ncbi:gamma-glutamyltransferase family protein [Methylocapsa sp. S129]|uniref:gamma-glutamyltransferase family protein n=1 Tax=Methylocapsa sp. S129 TaxID=1641869 RepID=UPI00131CC4F3|nr:gamma-glutamyltransferase [Methylocapsa sp. S129]